MEAIVVVYIIVFGLAKIGQEAHYKAFINKQTKLEK
jgi:hypothetical protein